jgi:hypothetical protein
VVISLGFPRGQSRDTGNIGYSRQDKDKKKTIIKKKKKYNTGN